MRYLLVMTSTLLISELLFAAKEAGSKCTEATFDETTDVVEEYHGAGSYIQIPPVHIQVKEMYKKGQSVKPADLFQLLVQERNYELCNCDPGLTRRLIWGSLNEARGLVSRLFGTGVSATTWYKKRLGAQLSRAKGDFDGAADLISQERNSMISKLNGSIWSDTRFAQINNEIFYLLESARASEMDSAAVKLVNSHYDLMVDIIELQNAKIQIEHSGKPISKAEKTPGTYGDISLRLTGKIYDLQRIESEIKLLLNRKQDLETEQGRYESELLRKWQVREKFRKESQVALADLYVQLTRLKVLESMLEGDLSGIEGPVSQNYLAELNKTLRDHRVYLSHPKVLGSYFKSKHNVKGMEPHKPPLEQYNTARDIANKWVSIWYRRVEEIDVRIQFNFAVANVSYELLRFAMRNNLSGTKKTIHEAGGSLWRALQKVPQKAYEFRHKKKAPRLEVEYSKVQLEEINTAKSAFEELFEYVRMTKGGNDQELLARNEVRDSLASLEYYFETAEKHGEPIHPDIIKILSSAKAIDLHNWMIHNAHNSKTGGAPYSLVVANKILRKQLESLSRYDSLSADLLENLAVWSGGAASLYYIVMPALSTASQYVFSLF